MSKIKFDLKDGMEIFCRGRLDVYPPHGKYQMIVSSLEPKGVGALELAFRQLHDKLAKAGLFDPTKKRPLPKPIRKVAVISSPSGAAVRDFLQVLARRTRRVDVVIVPVSVQGDGAAEEIAAAIKRVNEFGASLGVDCLVVTRGGGSVEDLWAFNEEVLVRAVAASKIPVVSAVGHEIDVSLCDLAADVRALTPSEAAERLAPEDAELNRTLVLVRRRMEDSMEKRLRTLRERIQFYAKHPAFSRPERLIENRRRSVDLLEERLERSIDHRLQTVRERLAKTAATLHALSPLAVLARGFSVTQDESGRVVRSINDVANDDHIRTRLADGTIESVVRKL
jgi:exodeoxyribonuclease VII large subunit